MTYPVGYTVWPFPPDWKSPFVTNYAYKTEVFSSRVGKEQRRALRHNPRYYCEFDFVLLRGQLVEFDRLMQGRQNAPIIMQDVAETDTTAATLAIGGASVSVTTAQPWMRVGTTILIGDTQAHVLQSVSGTTLGIYPTSTAAWPAGTKVSLGYKGYIQATTSIDTPTNTVGKGKVRFDAVPLELPPVTPPAAGVTWNGREVFLKKPNWSSAPQIEYGWPVEAVDYGRGATAMFNVIDFCQRAVKQTFVGKTRAEVREFRDFHDRMKGSRGEFYAPTWRPDMELVSNVSAGSSTMTVAGTTLHVYLDGNTVNRQVAVVKTDGSLIYNEVSSMAISGDNTVVTFANTWPAINTADVLMVCWMPAWTLASDILTISWLTDSVATIGLSMRTVEDIDV